MSKKLVYSGSPLAVSLDYGTGKYTIFDRKTKTYGSSYDSYSKAEKHAKGWNRIYKGR
jgi:hypothetical protein